MDDSFIQRFVFDRLPVRGAFVILDEAWRTIATQRPYPEGVKRVLGELITVNIMLNSNLKLNGKVVLEIQDNPKVDLVVSECSSSLKIRAMAKCERCLHSDSQISYADCLNDGQIVISIRSHDNGGLYQSIVPLNGNSVTASLENYMLQSEQLKTVFILAYTNRRIAGFMLQQLPDVHQQFTEELNRIFLLAATLSQHELLSQDVAVPLHKLFNEDDIILFEPHSVKFECGCSRGGVANMLRSLGRLEAESIIAEQGKIEVTCEFCNSVYLFDQMDIENIFYSLDVDISETSHKVH